MSENIKSLTQEERDYLQNIQRGKEDCKMKYNDDINNIPWREKHIHPKFEVKKAITDEDLLLVSQLANISSNVLFGTMLKVVDKQIDNDTDKLRMKEKIEELEEERVEWFNDVEEISSLLSKLGKGDITVNKIRNVLNRWKK